MTKDEAREAALLAACGLEPDHGTFGAECRFSRTVVDYMFDAGYDFAKSESNDKAVIDGFLARVISLISDEEGAYYYTDFKAGVDEVYDEMFGKEKL